MSYVNFFGFRASLWYLTSGKNFMVIRPAVPDILGGVVPPPMMLLGCQKQQMLLTVKRNLPSDQLYSDKTVMQLFFTHAD